MEVVDFSSARGIYIEPSFVWWVTFTLSKRDRIIDAVISITRIYPINMVSNYRLQFKNSMILTRRMVIPYGVMY